MAGLKELDDQLADLYDFISAKISYEELRVRVRPLLGSLTHDDRGGRIDQFGQKLLFPRWRIDFQTYGHVFTALFGDIREDGITQRLYQLFVELVRLECEPQSDDSQDSTISRVQGALHRYLTIRGCGLCAYPGLGEFVPVPVEGAPPLARGYILSENGQEFTEHSLGTTVTFDENDVRNNLAGRAVESLFSDLCGGVKNVAPDECNTVNDWPQHCTHSQNFGYVNWYGTKFTFSATQQGVVQRLWKAKIDGTHVVSDADLLEACGSDAGLLRDVFRSRGVYHPAWNTLIVKAGASNQRKLADGKLEEI